MEPSTRVSPPCSPQTSCCFLLAPTSHTVSHPTTPRERGSQGRVYYTSTGHPWVTYVLSLCLWVLGVFM